MKREFLAGLELSEEVINQIMGEHGKTVQGVQSKLDEAEEKLKTANSTLDTLKKSNKDNEELQNELKTYKDKVTQLEAQAKESAKQQTIKDALTNAKATDVDYLMYKLGEVEVDENGAIKDLDNKIKDLQTNHPTFFQTTDQAPGNNGFKSLGGADLPDGKRTNNHNIASAIGDKSVNFTDFLLGK